MANTNSQIVVLISFFLFSFGCSKKQKSWEEQMALDAAMAWCKCLCNHEDLGNLNEHMMEIKMDCFDRIIASGRYPMVNMRNGGDIPLIYSPEAYPKMDSMYWIFVEYRDSLCLVTRNGKAIDYQGLWWKNK